MIKKTHVSVSVYQNSLNSKNTKFLYIWGVKGKGLLVSFVASHRTHIYCSRSRNIKIFISFYPIYDNSIAPCLIFFLWEFLQCHHFVFNTQPYKRNKRMLRKEKKIKPDDNMQCNSVHNAQSMLVSKSPVSQLSPIRYISRYPPGKTSIFSNWVIHYTSLRKMLKHIPVFLDCLIFIVYLLYQSTNIFV